VTARARERRAPRAGAPPLAHCSARRPAPPPPDFYSDLMAYAKSQGVPVVQTAAKPYSMDENMMHISYEAGILEDPSTAAPGDMFRMTVDPAAAPNKPALLRVHFEAGLPVRVTNEAEGVDISGSPLKLFEYLNKVGGAHGVGRSDVVENRFVGIKSRGVYETPGAEILRQAHMGLEGLTLDREVFKLRDMMSAKFSEYAYNGFWFSPEMDFVLAAIKKSQERVTGSCDVQLFKGRASIASRASKLSLYNPKMSSMDEGGGWNPQDSTGFIRINAVVRVGRRRAHASPPRQKCSLASPLPQTRPLFSEPLQRLVAHARREAALK